MARYRHREYKPPFWRAAAHPAEPRPFASLPGPPSGRVRWSCELRRRQKPGKRCSARLDHRRGRRKRPAGWARRGGERASRRLDRLPAPVVEAQPCAVAGFAQCRRTGQACAVGFGQIAQVLHHLRALQARDRPAARRQRDWPPPPIDRQRERPSQVGFHHVDPGRDQQQRNQQLRPHDPQESLFLDLPLPLHVGLALGILKPDQPLVADDDDLVASNV